ncbi:MAG: hypothetical protein R3356_08800 [Eudoraea sp.]|nr:hypothetical protein [Eudoraea sp.]
MYPIEVKKKPEGQNIPTKKELPITLIVDTEKLYHIEQPAREDINAYCELYDSNPPETHKHDRIEHFESIVVPGQQVKWIALPKDKNSEYTVAIESVVYAAYKKNELDDFREANFFNAIAICSSDGEKVHAKIKDDFEKGSYVYIYNLNFKISLGGLNEKCYSIDPRLKIDQ